MGFNSEFKGLSGAQKVIQLLAHRVLFPNMNEWIKSRDLQELP